MKLSLRVICDRGIIETVKQRVNALRNYLNLSDDYAFLPYWKDEACVVLEFNTKIENPNHSKIQQYIKFISGTDNISQCGSSNDWECAYFASLDELHTNPNVAFVVCSIFEG